MAVCCSGLDAPPSQTLFLGCSIASFSASMAWNSAGASDLTVILREDPCVGPRVWYTTALNIASGNTADLGFFGEDRYQRSDGTQYSSCIKENPSDTLVRAAVDLIAMPVLFRLANFEGSFIVNDWTKTLSPNDAPEYRIKLVDPRLILEGVQLIIGDYTGSVSGIVPVIDGGTGYPQTNLFNIYGYLEQFGLVCPSYSQCTPGVYAASTTCPTAVDGPQFGSLVGGFGGALSNNQGMPYNHIITGFNFLANSVPNLSNAFSPYGRVAFHSTTIPGSLTASGCGLIVQDNFGGIYANKNFYFVDLRELPSFPSTAYRFGGTSMSLLDLINQASEDLNFDYYFELLPIKDAGHAYSNTDVAKVIKLRTTLRQTQPDLDKICEFIQDSNCVLSSSVGQELRNETVSKFLIGGNKQTVYQVQQNLNPDGGSASGITSLDSALMGVRTDSGCTTIDDVILPYFGTDYNGDYIVPCLSGDPYWGNIYYFRAPLWTIQSELQTLHFGGKTHAIITEIELVAALSSYTNWEAYAYAAQTDTWSAMPSGAVAQKDASVLQSLVEGRARMPQDLSNPKVSKIRKDTESLANRQISDMQAIYNWVRSYATDYYGKKFAVRVPFTCVVLDTDSYQPIISESPTNDGGWTEVLNVLGLTNNGPLTLNSDDPLNFFRNEEQRITPFVRIDNAINLDVSNLPKDSYFLVWSITSGTPASGSGPPSGVPSAGAICYQDTLSGIIWVYYFNEWLPINEVCMLGGEGAPGAELEGSFTIANFCPVYKDLDSGIVYIAGDSTYTSSTAVTVDSWDIQATLYLYVKATVEEEYVYHDKSNFFAPRVIVELPDSVPMAQEIAAHVVGAEEALRALKRRGQNALTNDEIRDITRSIQNKTGADSGWIGGGRFTADISAAAIPMKHKTLTYGPWFNPTVVGRVEIVNDSNLVPWSYNGMAGLNAAANALCNESRVFMKRGELGSITVASVPTIPLGAELTAVNAGYYGAGMHLVENRTGDLNTVSGTDYNSVLVSEDYLGINFPSTWSGVYGPNVTDINVQVDVNNFSTTYNMRTFAPRRGFFERFNANRIQQFSTNISKIARLLREEDANQKRLLSTISRGGGGGGESEWQPFLYDEQRKPSTTAPVIVGENVKNSDPRSAIAVMPLTSCQTELGSGFTKKAFSSWDVLLRPVSLDGDGNLPRLARYTGTSGVLQDDLIPMTNPSGRSRSHVARNRTVVGAATTKGHDFEILGRSGADVSGLMHKQISGIAKYTNDYRFMALRGPLILTGWGFDTEGYPVPNEADTYNAAASGEYTTAGRTDKFLSGHLQLPETWVTAPVDLRFDRNRGVWVGGSGSAPATQPTSSEPIVVYLDSDRNNCCLWSGFYKRVSTYENSLCLPVTEFDDILLYNPCNILSSGNCVVARPMEGSGTLSSGCNPLNLPVYRFLTMATGPADKTPCDCCCPTNVDGQTIEMNILQPSCINSSGYTLYYTTGVNEQGWFRDCNGDDYIGLEISNPLNGFALPSGTFINITVQYPVILVALNGTSPDSPWSDTYWARTSYSTWTYQSLYVEDQFISSLLIPATNVTLDSNNGLTKILTDANGDVVTDTVTFRYKVFLECDDTGDGPVDQVSNAILFHYTPAGYPNSGIIGDHRYMQYQTLCAFNRAKVQTSGVSFGSGGDCPITIEAEDSISYDLAPFVIHYFGMCPCANGNYPVAGAYGYPDDPPAGAGFSNALDDNHFNCLVTETEPIVLEFVWY